MKNVNRIPLAERLNAFSDGPYHPLYSLFIVDFFESLAALDSCFAGAYENELAPLDRDNEMLENYFIAEFLCHAHNLSPDERRLVQYKILIEPFVWLAQQGGTKS